MYKKLKNILGDLNLSLYSGISKEEPGDMYTDKLMIEAKARRNYSEGEIAKWHQDAVKDCIGKQTPVLIVKKTHYPTKVYIDIYSLGIPVHDIVPFNLGPGIEILKMLNTDQDVLS
ncbi:hypothetical protein A3K72_00650 [Candidatus Woesearchaeota archaeon RBG_13_36_6]|nr:MAG: hypothetical protein A3K72_00650 [Candidatus Woesearchaeota archaeon RBG_13_36_6]